MRFAISARLRTAARKRAYVFSPGACLSAVRPSSKLILYYISFLRHRAFTNVCKVHNIIYVPKLFIQRSSVYYYLLYSAHRYIFIRFTSYDASIHTLSATIELKSKIRYGPHEQNNVIYRRMAIEADAKCLKTTKIIL